MSDKSNSSQRRDHSQSKERVKPHKIFVTSLDGQTPIEKLRDELKDLFSKYGEIESVVVKRSYNHQYSYAFVDFKEGEDATEAVSSLDQASVFGSKMKVELQDDSRRRKGANEGCYNCGKTGHFARECHGNDSRRMGGRGRSRSHSHHHKKSKKRYSSSSESRSFNKKKQKKKRDSKSKKKHSKKHKKHYEYSQSSG